MNQVFNAGHCHFLAIQNIPPTYTHFTRIVAGTRMWTRGGIIWGANTGLILIVTGMGTGALIFFQFILIPVMLSYFFVFLVAPLMDLFEHRPMQCGCVLCVHAAPHSDNIIMIMIYFI